VAHAREAVARLPHSVRLSEPKDDENLLTYPRRAT
jgi:hypothetical protein